MALKSPGPACAPNLLDTISQGHISGKGYSGSLRSKRGVRALQGLPTKSTEVSFNSPSVSGYFDQIKKAAPKMARKCLSPQSRFGPPRTHGTGVRSLADSLVSLLVRSVACLVACLDVLRKKYIREFWIFSGHISNHVYSCSPRSKE